jgi:competence protein ComEC
MIFSLRFYKREKNPLFGLTLIFSLFSAGMLLIGIEQHSISELDQKEGIFLAHVSDYPAEKENSLLLTLDLDECLSQVEPRPLHGGLLIYVPKVQLFSSLLPGDRITVKCRPEPVTNNGNPYEFDYRFYLSCHGIRYTSWVSADNLLMVSRPVHRGLKYSALVTRNRISKMFEERGLTGDRLFLTSAIILGDKSNLDRQSKQYFITAGIMHIMAVSGLHAVILSYFVFSLLFFMKGRFNILRITVTLLILWGFAFITGLTPSVLRATLMFSFLQAGKLLNRPVNSLNSVLASAVILIIIRPSVIFDAGFLLSYSAVIYIIIFYSDVYMLLKPANRFMNIVWQSAAVTVTAQAGTLPLTIMLFNRFPTWFILTNVIIVPVSSLMIIVGALIPLTYPWVFISSLLARGLGFLAWLTEYLTETAASLPFASISNIGLNLTEFVFLTASLLLLLWFFFKKPRISFIIPLIFLLLFAASFSLKHIRTQKSSELIVYNTVKGTAVGYRRGHRMDLFTDYPGIPQEVARHAAVLGLKIKNNELANESLYLLFNSRRICISSKNDSCNIDNPAADIYIFRSVQRFSELKKLSRHDEKMTVIVPGKRIGDKMKKELEEAGIRLWQTGTEGAYCLKM